MRYVVCNLVPRVQERRNHFVIRIVSYRNRLLPAINLAVLSRAFESRFMIEVRMNVR